MQSPVLDIMRSRKFNAREEFIIEVGEVSRCPNAIWGLNREWVEGSVQGRQSLELPNLNVSNWKIGAINGRCCFHSPLLSLCVTKILGSRKK